MKLVVGEEEYHLVSCKTVNISGCTVFREVTVDSEDLEKIRIFMINKDKYKTLLFNRFGTYVDLWGAFDCQWKTQ